MFDKNIFRFYVFRYAANRVRRYCGPRKEEKKQQENDSEILFRNVFRVYIYNVFTIVLVLRRSIKLLKKHIYIYNSMFL